jgi:hypothetical protein
MPKTTVSCYLGLRQSSSMGHARCCRCAAETLCKSNDATKCSFRGHAQQTALHRWLVYTTSRFCSALHIKLRSGSHYVWYFRKRPFLGVMAEGQIARLTCMYLSWCVSTCRQQQHRSHSNSVLVSAQQCRWVSSVPLGGCVLSHLELLFGGFWHSHACS